MTTGERIKSRRKELGLSAEALAQRLELSPATIYRYENGYIEKVPGDRLLRIAEALRTTPEYLMGWTAEEPAPEPKLAPEQQKVLDLTNKIVERLATATPEQLETVSNILDAFFGKR